VLFVPANVQPLKTGAHAAPADLRVEMVRQLVGDDARFAVDTVEVDRPGVSFMVDTLEELKGTHPDATLFLIAGEDVLESFTRWRQPGRVLSLAHLAIVSRSGVGAEQLETVVRMADESGGLQPVVVRTRTVEVSSTEIRARVSAGLSIRGFVPDTVSELITASGLYR
jgi:nicotinate-nucleotide adenylyltransferase